jgi:hypothetical protein
MYISNDIPNLLSSLSQSEYRYQEISSDQRLSENLKRWPLLQEIHEALRTSNNPSSETSSNDQTQCNHQSQ